jgi:hypothetical protein
MPIVLIDSFFSLTRVLISVFFVSEVNNQITIKTIIESNVIKYCKIEQSGISYIQNDVSGNVGLEFG